VLDTAFRSLHPIGRNFMRIWLFCLRTTQNLFFYWWPFGFVTHFVFYGRPDLLGPDVLRSTAKIKDKIFMDVQDYKDLQSTSRTSSISCQLV